MSGRKPGVKICGNIRLEDVEILAKDDQIDYIGFIVDYPQSPRSVSVAELVELSRVAGEKAVAVFVNKNLEDICAILDVTGVKIVQLHGEESTELCSSLRDFAEVWKAVIGGVGLEKYKGYVDKIMVDSGRGSGKLLDLESVSELDFDILAGGLNSGNLREVITKTQPKIVDLNSGVESAPGVKDFLKIEECLKCLE